MANSVKAKEARENVRKANDNLHRIFEGIEKLSKQGKSFLKYGDLCYVHHIELSNDEINKLNQYGYSVQIIKKSGEVNKFVISWE